MIRRRRERPPVTNEFTAMIEGQVALIQQQHRDDLLYWQSRTFAERSEAIIAVCQDAVIIMEAQRNMGMPIRNPNPWPQSTQEILRRLAADARR